MICVNHGLSEEPGMVTLTRYINDYLDGVAAVHLAQSCRFQLVGAASPQAASGGEPCG